MTTSTNGDQMHDDTPPLGIPRVQHDHDEEERAIREAAEAVAHEGTAQQLEKLWRALGRWTDAFVEHATASRQRDQWNATDLAAVAGKVDGVDAKVDRHHEHNLKAHREAADRQLAQHQAVMSAIRIADQSSGDVRTKVETLHDITVPLAARFNALDRRSKIRLGAALASAVPIVITVWELAKLIYGG